jgi:hypothetical protein
MIGILRFFLPPDLLTIRHFGLRNLIGKKAIRFTRKHRQQMAFLGPYPAFLQGLRFIAQELFQQRYDEGKRSRARPSRRHRRRFIASFPGRQVAPAQPIYPEQHGGSKQVSG